MLCAESLPSASAFGSPDEKLCGSWLAQGWQAGTEVTLGHACPQIVLAIVAFLPAPRRMRGSPGGAHLPEGIKFPRLKLFNLHSDTRKFFF